VSVSSPSRYSRPRTSPPHRAADAMRGEEAVKHIPRYDGALVYVQQQQGQDREV